MGQAASFESLARNSDRGEARIGLEGESESWEGSLWECGHHHRARWGPWLDTHELLPECGRGLTARAPRGGGTGDRDLLPLGAPLATLWLLLLLLPSPHTLLSSPGGISHGGWWRRSSSLQPGLALGRPPLWDPNGLRPGLWDGRLRPACWGGGLSKKQQINPEQRWDFCCHTDRRGPVWPLPAPKKISCFSFLKALWKMKPPFLLRVLPSQHRLLGTHSWFGNMVAPLFLIARCQ